FRRRFGSVRSRAAFFLELNRRQRRHLFSQVDDQPFSRFLANAWNQRETGQVVRLDRGDEFVRANAREQCDAKLWADTADGDEVDEQLALARRLEAVELQRVFFYVRVDAQLNFRTRIF